MNRAGFAAWSIGAYTIVIGTIAIALILSTSPARGSPAELIGEVFYVLTGITTALVGAFVADRRSRNPLGWIMCAAGAALVSEQFVQLYAGLAFADPTNPLPGGLLAAWLGQWLWAIPYVSVAFLFLLFPTGHLLTSRWRWVAVSTVIVFAAMLALPMFSTPISVTLPDGEALQIQNPLGGVAWDDESFPLRALLFLMIAVILAALISLILRFVRARGIERQQLKWFLYAGAVFVAALILTIFINDVLFGTVIDIVGMALPLSVGIAILRYHLFDIDLIIRRTLTYALVVTLLAFVYLASVVLLQQVFASLSGIRNNEFITVVSTLGIAALFVPLRNWIQNAIDRRFYRKKYDAQKVLQEFGETVRDETDLETLTARLIQVVNDTMQPRSVSVWLKKGMERQIHE